jgi:tetratricopeptide (TPR) repeat protein
MGEARQAEHDAACASLERGIAAADELGDRIPFTQFVVDPFVGLRANLAVPLMYLGKAEQAQAQVDSALARAHQLGQPTAIMLALWVSGMLALRRGDPYKVAEIARTLGKLVEDSMLTQADGPTRWLRGWSEAQLGSPRQGFRDIREGFESHARLGMYAGNTEVLGHAAEAMLLAGDLHEAERQLDEAFALAHRISEYPELPNFMLLRARVALARGAESAALESIRGALAESRTRRSPYLELKSLVALCERPEATAADRDALRRAWSDMPEGRDMVIAQRAAQILHH